MNETSIILTLWKELPLALTQDETIIDGTTLENYESDYVHLAVIHAQSNCNLTHSLYVFNTKSRKLVTCTYGTSNECDIALQLGADITLTAQALEPFYRNKKQITETVSADCLVTEPEGGW